MYHIRIYEYSYIYIHIFACIRTNTYIYVTQHTYNTYIYIYAHVYIYIYMYVFTFIQKIHANRAHAQSLPAAEDSKLTKERQQDLVGPLSRGLALQAVLPRDLIQLGAQKTTYT